MEIIYRSSFLKILKGGILVLGLGAVLFLVNLFVYSISDFLDNYLIYYFLFFLIGFVDLVFVIVIIVFFYKLTINHKCFLLLNDKEFRYTRNFSKVSSFDWDEVESISFQKAKIGHEVIIRFKEEPAESGSSDTFNPSVISVPISTYKEKPEIIFEEMQKYFRRYSKKIN